MTMMKRIVFITIACILLASCAPKLYPTDRTVHVGVIDLRKYTDDNFFISFTPYVGEFDPIGFLSVEIVPAQKITDAVVTEVEYGFAPMEKTVKVLAEEEISYQELLDMLVGESKKLEANAVVNIKVEKMRGFTNYQNLQ
jgi:uncharacterized protein YbjQ (UPF0145 family)